MIDSSADICPEPSLQQLPTSSSVHGSTTTATELAGGISSRMATPSETCLTLSRTGPRKWSIRCQGVVLAAEVDTALSSFQSELLFEEYSGWMRKPLCRLWVYTYEDCMAS